MKGQIFKICYVGSLIFFKHFKIMVEEALPPLTARHWYNTLITVSQFISKASTI